MRRRLRQRRLPAVVKRRPSRTEILHLIVAVAVCVVIPAFSYARGEGGFSWMMFSRSDSFRVDVTAVDHGGQVHLLHPIELADGVEPMLRFYLRGADRFRMWPVGATFAARLPELARLGCRSGRFGSVTVTLEQRATLDAPVKVTRARVNCP